jgi:hypothetical protein
MRTAWLFLIVTACAPRAAINTSGEADTDGDGNEVGLEGDDDPAALAVEAGAPGPLFDEVRRELDAMRTSTYSHKTVVHEAKGQFDVDCSGLVDYALGRVAPDALAELRAATVRRPLAKHYVAFLHSLPAGVRTGRWRPLARVSELAPGDVLAWLRPADVPSHNTGHVMVVRDSPQRDPRHPDRYVVQIIDSTHAPHGRSDPRSAAHHSGLGIGDVVVIVDDHGAPIGYHWSTSQRSRPHTTTVALGRVE